MLRLSASTHFRPAVTPLFDQVSAAVAEQIYQGYWFDPTTQSLLAAIGPFTRLAEGVITVSLYKGNVFFTGRKWRTSLNLFGGDCIDGGDW